MVEDVVDIDVLEECLTVCEVDLSWRLEVNANVLLTSFFLESLK